MVTISQSKPVRNDNPVSAATLDEMDSLVDLLALYGGSVGRAAAVYLDEDSMEFACQLVWGLPLRSVRESSPSVLQRMAIWRKRESSPSVLQRMAIWRKREGV